MKRVFIVVGHEASRKSSTIRALTGAGSGRKVLQVKMSNNNISNIFVCHASLQEIPITPENFIAEVEKIENNPDVLVALRANASQNPEFPNADEYISHFVQAGWQIAGISCLYRDENRTFSIIGFEPIEIFNSILTPANEIAHIIREQLNRL
jgi:hypothetical protein